MKRLKQAQYQLVKFSNLFVVQVIERLSFGSGPFPIYSWEEVTTEIACHVTKYRYDKLKKASC